MRQSGHGHAATAHLKLGGSAKLQQHVNIDDTPEATASIKVGQRFKQNSIHNLDDNAALRFRPGRFPKCTSPVQEEEHIKTDGSPVAGHDKRPLRLGQLMDILAGLLEAQELKICSSVLDILALSSHGSEFTSVTTADIRQCTMRLSMQTKEMCNALLAQASDDPRKLRMKRSVALRHQADMLDGRANHFSTEEKTNSSVRGSSTDAGSSAQGSSDTDTGETVSTDLLQRPGPRITLEPPAPDRPSTNSSSSQSTQHSQQSMQSLLSHKAPPSSARVLKPVGEEDSSLLALKSAEDSALSSLSSLSSAPCALSSTALSSTEPSSPKGVSIMKSDLMMKSGSERPDLAARAERNLTRAWSRDEEEEELEEFENVIEEIEEGEVGIQSPSRRWVINPNIGQKHLWDLCSLIFIISEAYIIPLNVGFDFDMPVEWYWLTVVWFSLDICLSCITGYYQDGKLVMKQRRIMKHFLMYRAVIDIPSTIPWEYLLNLGGSDQESAAYGRIARIGKILRLMRLLRLVKLNDLVHRLEELLPGSTVVMTLTIGKMILVFTLFCHWAACTWGFLGQPEKVGHSTSGLPPFNMADCEPGGPCEGGIQGSPWMRRYALEDQALGPLYLTALNFATAIITGGDLPVLAGWWGERAYTVIMMVVSFVICSTILSQIVVFVERLSADQTEFNENLRVVIEYMVRRNVTRTLRTKVKRYLEFQFRARRKNGEGFDFMSQLSPWLRLELKEHLNRDIILRHPLFQGLPVAAFKRVCAIASTVLYAPGDVVVEKGHIAGCMFFIVVGRLRIIGKNSMLDPNKDKERRLNSMAFTKAVTSAKLTQSNATVESQKSTTFLRGFRTTRNNRTTVATLRNEAENDNILEPPCWLGDQCLFLDRMRQCTVICLEHTELLTLPKDLFDILLKEFPKIKPWYEEWRTKVISGDYKSTGIQCEVCGKFGHTAEHCSDALRFLESRTNNAAINTREDRERRHVEFGAENTGPIQKGKNDSAANNTKLQGVGKKVLLMQRLKGPGDSNEPVSAFGVSQSEPATPKQHLLDRVTSFQAHTNTLKAAKKTIVKVTGNMKKTFVPGFMGTKQVSSNGALPKPELLVAPAQSDVEESGVVSSASSRSVPGEIHSPSRVRWSNEDQDALPTSSQSLNVVRVMPDGCSSMNVERGENVETGDDMERQDSSLSAHGVETADPKAPPHVSPGSRVRKLIVESCNDDDAPDYTHQMEGQSSERRAFIAEGTEARDSVNSDWPADVWDDVARGAELHVHGES